MAFFGCTAKPSRQNLRKIQGLHFESGPMPVGATSKNGDAWIRILCISEKLVTSMERNIFANIETFVSQSRHERTCIYASVTLAKRIRQFTI
jgi:hypothetical protein